MRAPRIDPSAPKATPLQIGYGCLVLLTLPVGAVLLGLGHFLPGLCLLAAGFLAGRVPDIWRHLTGKPPRVYHSCMPKAPPDKTE